MAQTIYMKNVPEELVRRVKVKAAEKGVSQKQFILDAIEKALQNGDGR